MSDIYDYAFFRIYERFKSMGNQSPRFLAAIFLTLTLVMILVDFVIVIRIDKILPMKPLIVIAFAIGAYIIVRRYDSDEKNRQLNERWQTEDLRKKKRNGWWLSLYILISLFGAFIYAIIYRAIS